MTVKYKPHFFDPLVEAVALSIVWALEKTCRVFGAWPEEAEARAYLLRLKVMRRRATRKAVKERLRFEKAQRDCDLWS